MRRVFIGYAHRTPITPQHGEAQSISYYDLAAPVLKALHKNIQALNQTRKTLGKNETWHLHSIIAGNGLGAGGNPARLMALAAGLPEGLPALSVDTQCCSGLDSIGLAYERLRSLPAGYENQVVLAGGAESASQAPIRMHRNSNKVYEQAPFTPWKNRDPSMIEAALALEDLRKIPKSRMFDWAIRSHRLSLAQTRVKTEFIIPEARVTQDSHTRPLTSKLCERAARLGRYNPCLIAPLADGASFAAVMSLETASFEAWKEVSNSDLSDSRDGDPLEVLDYHQTGSNPDLPGLSCAALLPWLKQSERRFAFSRSDLIVSLMESFCSQVLATIDDLGLNPSHVNPWGGLLAKGHPIGASGAVLVLELFKNLKPGQVGLAAIPAGGGLASGLLVRRG